MHAFLYRKASLLDQRCEKLFCMALIQPYIEYCSSSWYRGLSAGLKDRFDALQRKLVRFVLHLDPWATLDCSHFAQIGWLCMADRVRYFKLLHAKFIAKSLLTMFWIHLRIVLQFTCITLEEAKRTLLLLKMTIPAQSRFPVLPTS